MILLFAFLLNLKQNKVNCKLCFPRHKKMPTVIALDVSLSMSQPVVLPDVTEEYQRKHLANHGINAFLDYLGSFYKLEFVSLVSNICVLVLKYFLCLQSD